MVKQPKSIGIEMTGEIALAERSARRTRIHDQLGANSNHTNMSSVMGPTGQSVDLSVASSFYGGGVTITGGGPDETFKDEFGNECSRYTNRTIIINEHMASTADEVHNHNGPDITKGYGMTFQKRMIAFIFVASTIVLLLVLLLDIGKNDDGGNKEDNLAAAMGYQNDDIWEDDDDSWDQYTKSALGDD